jgi:Na+-driven multidrug efflux pump
VTAFLNIILDYLFIEYFSLGVSGIAMATVIAEAITMSYLIYRVRQTKLWCGVSGFRYDAQVMNQLLKQGLPPSVNMLMMAFGMYIITYFVAPFGKEAVAADRYANRTIFLMPVIGLNIAALAIISKQRTKSMGASPLRVFTYVTDGL